MEKKKNEPIFSMEEKVFENLELNASKDCFKGPQT